MGFKVKWKISSSILVLLSLYDFSLCSEDKFRKLDNEVRCGPLKHISSEKEGCYRRSNRIICPNVSLPRAIIRKQCRFPYYINRKEGVSYRCSADGKWFPMNHMCQSDCGKATSSNKYPWLAALYGPDETLICPGAIISPYHVVMSAKCITTASNTIYENYTIIAGKHYSNIHRKRNSQQTRKIKQNGQRSGQRGWRIITEGNVLLVEVDQEFEFLDDVRPACVDWQSFYEEWDYKDFNEGIIAGWEYNKEEVVTCASGIHYWKRNICWENLYRDFRIDYLMEYDKSCAVYTDDEPTCAKYFENGILFKPVRERYFLRGFANIGELGWEKYVIYTKVSSYFQWLKYKMKKNKRIAPFFETFGKRGYENVGRCLLPEHVQYGKFILAKSNTYPNGTWVPANTVLNLICNNSPNTKLSFSCGRNDWEPSVINVTCKKSGSCPSLQSSGSENVFCKLKDEVISCENPPANTTAVIVCKEFYTLLGQKPIYKCQNGKWDPPFRSCSLECGTIRVGETGFPTEVAETARNEYPWIVGIYKEDVPFCAGTLVSRRHVISAAHCFGNSTMRYRHSNEYWFIAGKNFKDYNILEPGFQIRTEATLYVNRDYAGPSEKYRHDITVIELDEEFIISVEVQPVCIDWESIFEDIDLTEGKTGVITGWGFVNDTGSPSHVLKKLAVPFQPKEVCLRHLPQDFSYAYAAADKICAGYSDNSINVCKNDGGAGLYFKSDGRRYFLRGIASLTMKTTTGCDANYYTLYTKLSKYLPWVARFTRMVL